MVCAFQGQHRGKTELINLARKECDGLKAGFALGRASDKGGIVIKSVIVHKIAEREAVSEKDGLDRRCISRYLITSIKSIQFFNVGRRIGSISIGVFCIKLCKSKKTKWDIAKLKASDQFSSLEFVKNLPDNRITAFIKSEDLIEIIKIFFAGDDDLTKRIDSIRDFESKTRNDVAHEIQPLNEKEIKLCNSVFENLLFLMRKINIIKKDSIADFLSSYDRMNDFILDKMN